VTLPLADFRAIRQQVPKATINDQFLCIVGGALHAYLSSKNELPEATMVAMVPMSLRGAEKGGDVGNQVGFTLMPVHSEIADPLERLRAICEAAQTSKRVTNAVGKNSRATCSKRCRASWPTRCCVTRSCRACR
jgi:diacylglycerol O-acyltransferase / wax synthase